MTERIRRMLLPSLFLSLVRPFPLFIALMAAAEAVDEGEGNNANSIVDYTCYPRRDYTSDNLCRTIQDGTCDDPIHDGSGGDECRNQDCIDCNIHCQKYDADCYGCLNAKGCYYCPGDGTCQNSDEYTSSNKDPACTEPVDYLSMSSGDKPEACIPSAAMYKDPLYEANEWVYDAINIYEVWDETNGYNLTGNGIVIRINDDGVDITNKEFKDRFDSVENSCVDRYLPNPDDVEAHGTAVAGILLGNANNDLCAVGIAHKSKFSSCNFFAKNVPFTNLAYNIDTFDISQNSIGMPACGDGGLVGEQQFQQQRRYEICPFEYSAESAYKPCEVCADQFIEDQPLNLACENAISKHCKDHYKNDTDACSDFPEIIIGGGTSCDYDKLPQSAVQAIETGIKQGRNGKGIIFVFASGNSFYEGDDINFSGWTNSRYTITVGAVGKKGKHADYSTPGAALFVSAPGGGTRDVGHLMTAGPGVDKCADSGQGTSFACPVVSGVISLMLEARPELTWRDVQGIIAISSRNSDIYDALDTSQVINGAGYWHSRWYGFGIIDAKAAIDTTINEWTLFTEELQAIGESEEENAVLSCDPDDVYISTIELTKKDIESSPIFFSESTVVLLDLAHYNRGDLELILVSPSGTESLLHAGKRPENTQTEGDERWKLMTVRNWGEDPTGVWQLKIRDLVTRENTLDDNIFRQWKLVVYGHSNSDAGSGGSQQEEEEEELPLDENKTPTTILTPSEKNPTVSPTSEAPTITPTIKPTVSPTRGPTITPTTKPTVSPTRAPTITPTKNPSLRPTSEAPTLTLIKKPSKTGITTTEDKDESESSPKQSIETHESVLEIKNQSCDSKISIESDKGIGGRITTAPVDVEVQGSCLSGLETIGGWYELTGNGNIYSLEACSLDASKSFGIHIFTGTCSNLTCLENQSRQVADCENGYATSWVSEPKRKYSVLISGLPVGLNALSSSRRRLELSDDFDFDLKFYEEEVPLNTVCKLSFPVPYNSPVNGSIVGDESLDVYDTCEGTEKTGVWYTLSDGNPNEDGIIVYEASTCNGKTNFYNSVSVFRGDCDSLDCVNVDILPCKNGEYGQSVYWTTAMEETFHIFVHAADNIETETYNAGNFNMDIRYFDRVPNDQCGGADEIKLDQDIVIGSTEGTKPDMTAITASSCETGSAGAWYRITGTGSAFQASTCSSETNHETSVYVFSGKCGSLTCIVIDSEGGNEALCSEPNNYATAVNFNTQEGIEYYILITGRRGQTGKFGLQINEIQTSPENDCSRALPVSLDSLSVPGSTLQATIDFPSGEICGVPLNAPGVWYTIEGTGKGVELSTCESNDYNTAISIFKGSCGDLKCITGTAAVDPSCDNLGVTGAFLSDFKTKYYAYIHGKPSQNNMGNFKLTYTEFDVVEPNEFCSEARAIDTDGSRIQGSTEDATHAAIHSSSCGVSITNPGLWYKFKGTGQPFSISACTEDIEDFDVSVSVFMGSCDDLLCITGATFTDNYCSSATEATARSLQQQHPSSDFRFMTEIKKDYFLFVHGQDGVGDFDLFVNEEISPGFGTIAPTATPNLYGKDLFRWVPVNDNTTISTDYPSLTIVAPPNTGGKATVNGPIILYSSPLNYEGFDVFGVEGCTQGKCYLFDVTIHLMGDKEDLANVNNGDDGDDWNKLWLLMLLLLLCPCLCLPLYFFYRKKKADEERDYDENDDRDGFEDDLEDPDSKGGQLLPYHDRNNDSSDFDEDWESSDGDDSDDDSVGDSEEDSVGDSDEDSFGDSDEFTNEDESY